MTYFFVYAVRQGTASWFVHYLMNVKGVESLAAASAQVSGLEVGGFFGALSAGTLPLATLRQSSPASVVLASQASKPGSLGTAACAPRLLPAAAI